MRKTTYTCDRCRKESLSFHHISSEIIYTGYNKRVADLCPICTHEVVKEIQKYARENRLRLLVTEGIIVKE